MMTLRQLDAHLNASGYPGSYRYLQKLIWLGKGPPAAGRYGQRYMYDPDRGIEWAKSRFVPAEQKVAQQARQ
jgi:hypothetical protein